MMASFVIHGAPFGKQRPKFSAFGGHVTVRTPKKTVNYENLVKMEYTTQCPGIRFVDGIPITADITAYYAIPKSVSLKKSGAMMRGEIIPTKRPDCDNVIKIILDALNNIAYRDDAQVAEIHFRKRYHDEPGVAVRFWQDD